MGILYDLSIGKTSREGIRAKDWVVTFDSFGSMMANRDVVRECLIEYGRVAPRANLTNWGTDENGKPVIIDTMEE